MNQIRGAREVNASLAAVEGAGGNALYLACDTSCGAKVEACMSKVRALGLKVTGLVHAAGVLRDKMVENKKLEDVQASLSTRSLEQALHHP